MPRLRFSTRTTSLGAVLLGLLFLTAGCEQDPYLPGYSFYPQPAAVNVMHRGPTEQTPLTTLATVVGVRRPDANKNEPSAIVIRLRFENNGPAHLTFDPQTLELVNGALRPFQSPQVQPAFVLELPPGQKQEITAAFPLPSGFRPEQINLRNLRLRWQVKLDNYDIPQSAIFEQGAGTASSYREAPPETY